MVKHAYIGQTYHRLSLRTVFMFVPRATQETTIALYIDGERHSCVCSKWLFVKDMSPFPSLPHNATESSLLNLVALGSLSVEIRIVVIKSSSRAHNSKIARIETICC